MELWINLLSSPIVLITALVIGTVGETVKRAVGSKDIERDVVKFHKRGKKGKPPAMWKRVYYYTLPAHPVMMGVLLGLIPWLPASDVLEKPGYDFAARIGTYSVAGVVCKVGYDTIVSTLKRILRGPNGDGDSGGSADGGSTNGANA